MEEENKRYDYVEDVEISKEMRTAFLDYSMSVIVSRALPDVRDGMKPVHRRILHAMNQLGITSGVAHKKSARIVGEVIGKYHPHGDTAVYDAMVRMAQDFSYRYPLVDGHGNFGSLDGDGAAAMRYTEARMSKISMEMLRDIQKDTVDFIPNYDGEESEPVVLPSRIPNLLINGAVGIAVGMATNIPPHNLSETIQAIFAVMDDPDITVPQLMEVIKGPDFPTGGIILGRKGIRQAFETGRGSIMIRSKYRVEELSNGKKQIIFYEIPYQVNKANLITKMASLIRDKAIQGVTYLNDESNREGIRIVMELKKDAQEEVILNQLFRLTPLQTSFGINMLALENGRPKQLPLKDIIHDYIDHQVDVVVRKTQFELKKAQDRAHILEGLRIAMDHIDEVIHMIRSSKKDEAGLSQDLCDAFGLSMIQAKAILAMQLRRLSGLERDKIENEYQQYLKMSPEFVHLTGESLKQQIGGLDNAVEKITAQMINLSTEIEALGKSEKEEDKKALEAKKARKESLNKALENAKKERDEQKPKLEKQLNRVQGFEKNKAQIERIKQIKNDLGNKKMHLEYEVSYNEKKISELEEQVTEIDKDENAKSVIAELEKMKKSDVKNFDVDDIRKLDELEAKKSDIDEKKAGIKAKIDSLKNANKDLEHKIDTLNTEIAKCDFAWKNLFANKTWDEIEAKSMDGRFTKKEEKAKQEEPSKEEPKQEKAPAAEKPTVEDIDKPVEPMWTDLQSEEEAKKEEAEQAAKENNEKALVKTSRWSKLWNAIKHPIQTIKAAREKAKSGEGKRIIKNGDAIKKDGEPEKTEAQSVDAFIAKLRQMSEKEAVKDAQNKDNKEQPDYSKYVARHARKVEAQKQRDDEGR